MNNSNRVILASTLGIITLLAALPALFIIIFVGYSNSMTGTSVSRMSMESKSMQELHKHLDRSYFSTVEFSYGRSSGAYSSGGELYISGILTTETLEDPEKFVEHINALRQEIELPFLYSLEDSEGRVVQFEFHEISTVGTMTPELLKSAFSRPTGKQYTNAGNKVKYNFSINTLTGEILAGNYKSARERFKTPTYRPTSTSIRSSTN